MIHPKYLAGIAAISLLGAGPAFASDTTSPLSDKHEVTFKTDMAYPESVTWSEKQGLFFVGSVKHGTVGTVSPDGTYKPFINDDQLISTIGVYADDAHDALWVANADPGVGDRTDPATQGKRTGVGKYDATTGKQIAYYDLGILSDVTHFANDIALDDKGNAYVTDSFAPIIYKIDTSGNATIFAQDPLFHDADGFNLNGIAYVRDGHLLVGKYNTGDLFRVNISDPKDITPAALPQPISGADGFNLIDDQHLAIAINMGGDEIIELESTDGWKSAKLARQEKSLASMPTAVTRAGNDLWVLNSRLDTLYDAKAEKTGEYMLQKF